MCSFSIEMLNGVITGLVSVIMMNLVRPLRQVRNSKMLEYGIEE